MEPAQRSVGTCQCVIDRNLPAAEQKCTVPPWLSHGIELGWRYAMKLIGNYLSPYVRRVAVTLNILNMPFELEELLVFKAPEPVRRHNPLVRIPVLVLDDGATLVESAAILDEIDRLVGPKRSLTPPGGLERRRVVQTTA